ncbi:hypothetical protein V1512DRAFT_150186 [Lipomyces arxii]|uniref:uncharacterized protein n=1 Tax=Lipomyces arxii TaxID=56418 RepID=UPI0034CE0BE5
MPLKDLSALVDRLTEDVEKLEFENFAKEQERDQDFVVKDAENIFRQTIYRNKLFSNLEYARKLLTQLGQASAVGTDINGSRRIAIQNERKRIRTVHDKLEMLDKTLKERSGTLKFTLVARKRETSDFSRKIVQNEGDFDLLSTPTPPTLAPIMIEISAAVPEGVSTTLESRIEYHRQQQSDIAASLLAQTQRLKQNAQSLGAKLDADKDVVQNAVDALDRNVTNMRTTGGRLDQYRNISAIGWRFYIGSILVMFVAVLTGVIIVKLLPKW